MLKDSPANRVLIRCIILLLQWYAPFCLGYVAWSLLAQRYPLLGLGYEWFLNSTLFWYLWAPEAIFYVFFIWYQLWIQREATHPPKRTQDQRLALFNKVRSEIYDPQTFLSGWFRGANPKDIGREELRRFLDWSFWEGRANQTAKNGDEMEMEEYISKIEIMMPQPFKEGKGKAKSLRLTLDPIIIEPRTLFWYGLMMTADTITLFTLMARGFDYHRRNLLDLAAVLPPRPAALYTKNVSIVPSFSYFHRKHTSQNRLPIIYLHGIGIGLLSGVKFLSELNHSLNEGYPEDDQVGIIALEILQISSRLTTPIPSRTEFLSQVTTILNNYFGKGRFVLAAHSYGTILGTHILNFPTLSKRVSATLLVDPVSMLLHMPDVAYNFTIRPPIRANEWMLWYFASKDPQIAHTLGRHFHWSENILWRDQIDHLVENHGMRLTASLSSDDLIVNTNAVRAYLTERDLPEPVIVKDEEGNKEMQLLPHQKATSRPWRGKGVDVIWWPGHDHAGVFDEEKDRAMLVEVLMEYVKGS